MFVQFILRGLKTPVAFLLLLSLVYQCLGSLGVFAWYEVNRTSIVANLCINRDKPELHCNGKCILAQKLRNLDDSDRKETNQGTSGALKLEIPAFIVQYYRITPIDFGEKAIRRFPHALTPYSFLPDADVFRPPIAG